MSDYHTPPPGVQVASHAEDLRPLTAEDLEGMTGIPRRFWWSAARAKALPSIRIERRVMFPRPALLRILAEGNIAPLLAAWEEGSADA